MCVKYGRAQELGLLLDSLTQSKHKLQLNAIGLQRDKHKQCARARQRQRTQSPNLTLANYGLALQLKVRAVVRRADSRAIIIATQIKGQA